METSYNIIFYLCLEVCVIFKIIEWSEHFVKSQFDVQDDEKVENGKEKSGLNACSEPEQKRWEREWAKNS